MVKTDPFSLNPDRTARSERIGREGAPLLIIEDALADPDGLIDGASSQPWVEVTGKGNHFPGHRSELPYAYAAAMGELLKPHLEADFAMALDTAFDVTLCHLQMVSLPREKLSLPQRVPHFDTPAPFQIAVLHYLIDSPHGGTAFYRHRATGFERISTERFAPYTQTLVGEVQRHGHPPADYIHGDTALFERIHTAEAVKNRIVAYFSNSLHSGIITPETPLSPIVGEGRLTASTFLRYKPI